jgi:hypothetical protein
MICDHCRNIEELKELYTKRPMPNQYDWDWLINNPNLFCFYGEEKGDLRGFITVQREGGKLTLSGTSVRKNMSDNIDAIIMVCNAFSEDMYSYTKVKAAKLCLLKAGFKHIKKDEYMRFCNNLPSRGAKNRIESEVK